MTRVGGADLRERISFSFNKITVDYMPQGQDGQARGATTFMDEWTAGLAVVVAPVSQRRRP